MRSFFQFYLQTFKDIFKHSSIFTTLVLSVFLYSFFYPIAYQAEHAESLPIIVVDEEQSMVTNQVIATVVNSPNVEIRAVTGNFAEAEGMLRNQQADGILLLPSNLSNSIRRGETGGIGLYLSAANFLKTQKIGLGLATSIENALVEHAEKFQNISEFSPALSIHKIPLFNPLSGYGSYIFPAVAPLIIHQTILLGLCMLIATYRQNLAWRATTAQFWGIFFTILTIGTLGCLYLFGFTFWLNDYPRGGNFLGMLIAVPIFLSSIIAITLFLATYLDVPERAGHVIVFSSIPLFLLSGTAWPHAAMPIWMQHIAQLLPSTQGIQMFIQLNQMGVSTYSVIPKLIYLSTVAAVFLCLAYWRLNQRRN